MEFQQVVYQRRSIRNYQERAVNQADLEQIIQAGLYAPSAVDLQPWYFVVLCSEESKRTLRTIMERVSQEIEPSLQQRFVRHPAVVNEAIRFLRKMGGAPVCILAFEGKEAYGKTQSTIVQSVAAAIENILLAAVDKGLGGCWLTAPLETAAGDELRDIFAPGKGSLVALLTLGYPAQSPKAPARKPGRYVII